MGALRGAIAQAVERFKAERKLKCVDVGDGVKIYRAAGMDLDNNAETGFAVERETVLRSAAKALAGE